MIQSLLHMEFADSKFQGVPAEILQSVGVELAIFLTTAVVAVALKGSVLPTRCSAGPVPDSSGYPPAKPSKPKTKVASPREKSNSGGCVKEGQQPRARQQLIDTIMERASGRSSEALALYAQLRGSAQHLQLIDSSSYSALDFYSTLVQCAIRADRPHLIQQIFRDMAQAGVPRPLELYESAMKLLAGKKQYQQALSVYDILRSEGLQPSSVTLSCLINFTAELEEYDRALQFFEQLASSTTPSIRAYMTVLRVHAKRQDWPASKAILRDMQQRNVTIDSLVLNIALATGVAAGKTVGTTAALNEFKEYADVVSYNTVIKGYAHQKDVSMAREMLELMVSRNVNPNLITYNTVMDAAVRKGQVDDAWQVLDQMCEAGLRPDKFSCTILVKGLQSSSTPKQLTTVVDILLQALPRCEAGLSSMMFRNIMEVAGRLKCLKLMLRVFDQLQEHIKPGAAEYQHLLQALLQQGDSRQAARIWQRILSDHSVKSTTLFTAVIDDFSRREQVDCMIGAFESLRCAILALAAGKSGEPGLPASVGEKLLQDCRSVLVRTASNKRHAGRALRNLLERAPELSTSVGSESRAA
mmetsp:Transcript_104570/g.181631  ORF Transcript_104570/g.181631 Transcript_104570/m.181631 type:complete len:584 (+) Transcript_104570:92-1843(+)